MGLETHLEPFFVGRGRGEGGGRLAMVQTTCLVSFGPSSWYSQVQGGGL
jgi:hypothetical protein